MRALARDDPDRYALSVVNQVLGGGMSSRLFQEVREKRGLAYSVYSYRVAFDGTGALGIYAGTNPERAQETLTVIRGELDRLAADGLPEDELAAAKGHLKGSTALALETSSSAACTGSAGASSPRTRSRRSTSWSRRSMRSRSRTQLG